MLQAMLLTTLALIAAAIVQQPTRATVPARPAAAPAAAPQPREAIHDIETADDLLLALESVDDGLRTLTTDILWAQTFALAGDMQLRWGRLFYRVDPPASEDLPPRRAFAIEFTRKQVGDRVMADDRVDYVFDGEWFLERVHADRQGFKRQVVPPGEVADPLRVGRGPFPIPVGQKREEILERFTAELVDPLQDLDERLVAFVSAGAGTYALDLTPLPAMARDISWRSIRVWYDRDTLEPRLAWTINAADDESYIQLLNIERDPRIDDAVFSTTVPTTGWELFVTPWNPQVGP